jgi:Uncharacterised protein family (UPF0261)
MAAVALVGTLDTKGQDFAFLAARLRAAGAEVIVIDAGTGPPDGLTPDVDGEAVAAAAGTSRAELRGIGSWARGDRDGPRRGRGGRGPCRTPPRTPTATTGGRRAALRIRREPQLTRAVRRRR